VTNLMKDSLMSSAPPTGPMFAADARIGIETMS